MPGTDLLQDDVAWKFKDNVGDEEKQGDDGVSLSYTEL